MKQKALQPRTSRLFYCCLVTFSVVVVVQVVIIYRLMHPAEHEGAPKASNSKLHMIQPKVEKAATEKDQPTPPRPDPSACGVGGDIAFYRGTEAGFWVCVHQKEDVVSNRIRGSGVWDDCEDETWLIWTLFGASGPGRGAGGFSSRAWLKKDRGSNAKEQSSAETGRQLVIVDVGANIGACSVRLAQLGHILVSFEPLRDNFLRLRGSIAINNLTDSVIAINAGAAEEAGTREALSESGNMGNTLVLRGQAAATAADLSSVASGANASFSRQSVEVVRLDEALGRLEPAVEAVDLLKLDCQGCELSALRGAADLIDAGAVSLIVTEFSPAHLHATDHQPEELLEWLHMKGFKISTLLMGKEVEPASFRAFVQQHRGRSVDLVARRDPPPPSTAEPEPSSGWRSMFKEKRDDTDRRIFVILCVFPIAFGCAGLYYTLITL